MAARLSIPRAARQFASSAYRKPSPFTTASCLNWQRAAIVPQYRLFSGSRAVFEKRYTEGHEWVELSADKKTATIGISNYAAQQLGDVVYVELPELELDIEAGEAVGAVESVKSASDIWTPVGGKVVEVNNALEEKPKIVSDDAEGEGWIVKIEVTGEEKGNLMSAEEYKEFTTEE